MRKFAPPPINEYEVAPKGWGGGGGGETMVDMTEAYCSN